VAWVGIVGSRVLADCSCDERKVTFPPDPETLLHREECRRLWAWLEMLKIVTRLLQSDPELSIVSGGARGADTLAMQAGQFLGIPKKRLLEIPVPPAPRSQSFAERAKGRNTKIVDKADRLIALFADGPRTSGTQDTVTKALAKGIPVHVLHQGKWLNE
jgi:hypothetical protein